MTDQTAVLGGDRSNPALPPGLMGAIAHPGGGRVVLILGAGCSVELPTGLPLSGELATECHRKLVADGVINEDACDRPGDLSCVADAVVGANGSQAPLVERFPPERFRHAEPNEGHLIAAALLRERAVTAIMTLNFDLAQATALGVLGAQKVATIRGPEDHHRLGLLNLIYLHRSIDAEPDRLILRTDALEDEWREQWEEVVARRVLASSVIVFAGLGTPAAVLVETSQKILAALGGPEAARDRVYVVDPAPQASSAFFAELGLPGDVYLQLPWTSFTRRLSERVVAEQLALLERECERLVHQHGWDEEDSAGLCGRLAALGLLGFGRLRARWMLEAASYLTNQESLLPLLGDLLLGIGMTERLAGAKARFDEEGVVEFEHEGRRTAILVCSGGGYMRWALLEVRVGSRRRALERRHPAPRLALVSGLVGGRVQLATPPNIVAGQETDSVVLGEPEFEVITVEELRADPARAVGLVS